MSAPTTLANGAEVLEYTERRPEGNGFRRHGVALCRWHEEYVVWTIFYRAEDEAWFAESGDYFQSDVAAAVDAYRQRAGLSTGASA